MNVGELLASVKVLVGHPRCMFCLSLNLLPQQLQSILIDLLHIHRIFPANCNSLKYQVPCGQLTWFGPSQFFDPISATRSMLFWVEEVNIWGHFPFLLCKHDFIPKDFSFFGGGTESLEVRPDGGRGGGGWLPVGQGRTIHPFPLSHQIFLLEQKDWQRLNSRCDGGTEVFREKVLDG